MPGMADRLSALGSRLLPYAADLRIEVIGSADAAPVKEGERFRDNGDLALARAVAAGRWLTHSARMPPAALTFHVRLPLTADLDALDRKNRTVALHLGAVDTR
jgi:flagellar motor protein MotB